MSFFSSFWCRGLAAVCDCGTPWTFLLTFLLKCTTVQTLRCHRTHCLLSTFQCYMYLVPKLFKYMALSQRRNTAQVPSINSPTKAISQNHGKPTHQFRQTKTKTQVVKTVFNHLYQSHFWIILQNILIASYNNSYHSFQLFMFSPMLILEKF